MSGTVTEKAEWARRYVGYGWTLLPITPGEKEPFRAVLRGLYGDTRTGHLYDAPAFREEVLLWLDYHPDAGLAVVPRATPGLVVVDVDRLDLLNPAMQTPTVTSGRDGGGRHLYFSSETNIPRTATEWGHVNPEYAVLPPSIHASGRAYTWIKGLSPAEIPFMPFEQAAPELHLAHLLEATA